MRVEAFQTSVTSVPNDVRVRLPELQTLAGIPVILESSWETIEDDAVLMTAAIDVEALRTFESVLLFTALVIPDVCTFVLLFMFAARDVEAVSTAELVLVLTAF